MFMKWMSSRLAFGRSARTTHPSGMPAWDCDAGDYYDGDTPAPGSYLDDHWNLVDSAWLSWTA